MAQGLPRTRFNASGLVRALAGLAVADVPEAKQSFAERLGQWLDFNDALSLFSALNAEAAGGTAPAGAAPSPESAAARKALARVRSVLADSIAAEGGLEAGKARTAPPAPGAPAESAADFAPWHRYYLARQRDMSAAIGPLRASVRAALSRQSPALKRLAVLDAVLDQALAVRERELLATVPVLLGKRFEQLYAVHRAARTGALAQDDPDRWMQPGGWLTGFRGELQAVLLAELDLRLQAVAGLIGALEQEVTSKQ